jgi:phosphate transport system protein
MPLAASQYTANHVLLITMSIHLQKDIDRLKQDLLSLCALVESQVEKSVRAFLDRDEELAREVINRDSEIDDREIDIEEECLKTLALHQPVAIDLRMTIAILKMNSDLERIGDLAVNIARKAIAVTGEPPLETVFDIAGMGMKSQAMLRDSIDALVEMNVDLARQVCLRDDEVDDLKHYIRIGVESMIRRQPEHTQALLRLLAVSRNLERIADGATNIAEDVIYLSEGEIARHGRNSFTRED